MAKRVILGDFTTYIKRGDKGKGGQKIGILMWRPLLFTPFFFCLPNKNHDMWREFFSLVTPPTVINFVTDQRNHSWG